MSSITQAAWSGRGDLLQLFASRGCAMPTSGVDALVSACALGDDTRATQLAADSPGDVQALRRRGALLMMRFAGVGNAAGLRLLVTLGVPVDVTQDQADGYHNRASYSTALHVAAWRARHESVRLLLSLGANPNALDSHRRSPLMLAVLSTVDSYWTDMASPDSVAALLAAGASVEGVRFPSGYAPADALLQARGAVASR
jgi:ankyrin repeat protein